MVPIVTFHQKTLFFHKQSYLCVYKTIRNTVTIGDTNSRVVVKKLDGLMETTHAPEGSYSSSNGMLERNGAVVINNNYGDCEKATLHKIDGPCKWNFSMLSQTPLLPSDDDTIYHAVRNQVLLSKM